MAGTRLVVGLGNPGIEYQFTPHNAGFLAIDRLADECRVAVDNRRSKALTARCSLAGHDVVLAKPETYMNLSGLAVGALVDEFDVDPARELIVVYDELDLPFGAIRVRERGGPAGHNGIRSIIGALGTQEFLRVRIGIGPEHPVQNKAGYVLAPLRKAQLETLSETLDRAAKAVETILTEGPGPAMSRFNGPQKEPSAGSR